MKAISRSNITYPITNMIHCFTVCNPYFVGLFPVTEHPVKWEGCMKVKVKTSNLKWKSDSYFTIHDTFVLEENFERKKNEVEWNAKAKLERQTSCYQAKRVGLYSDLPHTFKKRTLPIFVDFHHNFCINVCYCGEITEKWDLGLFAVMFLTIAI